MIYSIRKNIIIFLLSMCSAISTFAQIPIDNEGSASSDVNYSLNFRNPDFYSFPGFAKDWTNMYSTHANRINLLGEKILLLDNDIRGSFFDKTTGKFEFYKDVNPMNYYTIVNYFVCKEQIDSLNNFIYSTGVKVQNAIEAPEMPIEVYTGLLTRSKKKKIEEYEKQMDEYKSLPYSLPEMFNSEDYDLAKTWNIRPGNNQVIELLNEDGNSYYVDGLSNFIPVTMWNNLLGSLIGCELFIYKDELTLPSEWDPSQPEYTLYNKDFSSLTPNFVCEKVEVSADDRGRPDVKITVKGIDGVKTKGKLGAGQKRIHTENGDEDVPYYTVYINGVEYKMMSATQFGYYKNNYEVLLAKRKELSDLKAKEWNVKVDQYKKKYGDYYGQQIVNHEVCAGMSKEMCIEAWGEPLFQRIETEDNHKYEYLFYGLLLHKSVFLIDGKVSRVTEEK